jgi:hypothetical protein
MFKFKEKFKGFISGIIVSSIITTSLFTFAGGTLQTIQAGVNQIKLKVNGVESNSSNYLIDGRTYVQLRDACDLLGKELVWDSATSTADIKDKSSTTNNSISTTTQQTNTQSGKLSLLQGYDLVFNINGVTYNIDKKSDSGKWQSLIFTKDGSNNIYFNTNATIAFLGVCFNTYTINNNLILPTIDSFKFEKNIWLQPESENSQMQDTFYNQDKSKSYSVVTPHRTDNRNVVVPIQNYYNWSGGYYIKIQDIINEFGLNATVSINDTQKTVMVSINK